MSFKKTKTLIDILMKTQKSLVYRKNWIPLKVFFKFGRVASSIEAMDAIYNVLFLPLIVVVKPGDFIWLLQGGKMKNYNGPFNQTQDFQNDVIQ